MLLGLHSPYPIPVLRINHAMEKQETILEIINMLGNPSHVLRPHKYIANLKIYLPTKTRAHHSLDSIVINTWTFSHDCGHNLYVSEEEDFSCSCSWDLSIALQHLVICDLFPNQMHVPVFFEHT